MTLIDSIQQHCDIMRQFGCELEANPPLQPTVGQQAILRRFSPQLQALYAWANGAVWRYKQEHISFGAVFSFNDFQTACENFLMHEELKNKFAQEHPEDTDIRDEIMFFPVFYFDALNALRGGPGENRETVFIKDPHAFPEDMRIDIKTVIEQASLLLKNLPQAEFDNQFWDEAEQFPGELVMLCDICDDFLRKVGFFKPN